MVDMLFTSQRKQGTPGSTAHREKGKGRVQAAEAQGKAELTICWSSSIMCEMCL